ncbi:ATP-binding protein [Paraburkholderia phenoliruptrix]|uniref:ATP-binding protein n=1 Tax=Paraburkholderia phenoliruptrix TaxID=252970 RepID=UPI001CB76C3A|nr:ATP-binding protein [Paraburkholderia phenoliruptrix]
MPFNLVPRSPAVWVVALLTSLAVSSVTADPDETRNQVNLLPKYRQECASCHIAYPPGMLPESGATLELTRVDLSALAQRVAAELAPAAIAKRQSLEFEGEENCHITGDETLLAALVRNLVDNAIRYSPPGASVLIRTETNRDLTMLSVEDSGPGVADADRLKLGERFFRVSGTAESGSGLGWSIVQRIVDLHAAVVNVRRSSALGGLEVQITWHAR